MSTKKLDKNGQHRGGARVHNAGYRKVRVEMFDMVERLVQTTNTLSGTVGSQHDLIKGSANKVRDLKTKIADFETNLSEAEATEFILRDKIKHQDKLIMDLSNDVVDQAKKEVN